MKLKNHHHIYLVVASVLTEKDKRQAWTAFMDAVMDLDRQKIEHIKAWAHHKTDDDANEHCRRQFLAEYHSRKDRIEKLFHAAVIGSLAETGVCPLCHKKPEDPCAHLKKHKIQMKVNKKSPIKKYFSRIFN
jgi:hypothetical protein